MADLGGERNLAGIGGNGARGRGGPSRAACALPITSPVLESVWRAHGAVEAGPVVSLRALPHEAGQTPFEYPGELYK